MANKLSVLLFSGLLREKECCFAQNSEKRAFITVRPRHSDVSRLSPLSMLHVPTHYIAYTLYFCRRMSN